METILLTLEELQKLRPLSKNIDLTKTEAWIFEAQVNEMRDFLGGELYKTIIDDWNGTGFDTPRLESLWYGDETGQEIYFGLWRSIALFAIAKIIKNNSFNVTRFSNSNLSSDIEEPAVLNAQASKASQAESQAIKYLNETREYLIDNKTVYPEWDQYTTPENNPVTMKYLKVHPRSKNLKYGL